MSQLGLKKLHEIVPFTDEDVLTCRVCPSIYSEWLLHMSTMMRGNKEADARRKVVHVYDFNTTARRAQADVPVRELYEKDLQRIEQSRNSKILASGIEEIELKDEKKTKLEYGWFITRDIY